MKKQWLKVCNLSEETCVTEKRICSKHFLSKDYESYSKTTLLKTAFPVFLETTTVLEFKKVPQTTIPPNVSESKCVPAIRTDLPSTSAEICSLNDTYIEPRYLGDLTVEHFSTRERAKRSLSFVESAFAQKNKKIRLLQKQNTRLVKKIDTFKGLLNSLREIKLLSEEAADTVAVSVLLYYLKSLNRFLFQAFMSR